MKPTNFRSKSVLTPESVPLFAAVALLSLSSTLRVSATAIVSAEYSAGSLILDISSSGTVSDPAAALIGPITIPAGSGAQGSGGGYGSANVHHGSIKLFASNSITANPSLIPPNIDREGVVEFHGIFSDTVTVTAPGVLSGTPIVIVPVISTDYSFSGSAAGVDITSDASFASPGFTLTVIRNTGVGGNDFQQRGKGCFFSAAFPSAPCPFPALDTWVLAPITVQCGVPYDLSVYAQAAAGVRTVPGGSASTGANLSSTVNWSGVAAVTLTNQTVLSNYAFASESGFNYGVKLQAVSNAAPILTLELPDPETATICWPTVPLQIYRLESRTNLNTGSWTTVGDLVVGDGSPICQDHPIAGAARFYRVAKVPNP